MLKKLTSYIDKYVGQTAVIVGCGPTLFEYENLSEFPHPTFLINSTICVEPLTNSQSNFWSHHPGSFYKLVKKSIYFLPTNRHYPDGTIRPCWSYDGSPTIEEIVSSSQQITFVTYKLFLNRTEQDMKSFLSIKKFPEWCKNKNFVAKNNMLLGHTGSITSLIHFLWFCGFNKAILIGCNPNYVEHHHYDDRIASQSRWSKSWVDLHVILNNQTKFLENFNIEAEYLGDYNY